MLVSNTTSLLPGGASAMAVRKEIAGLHYSQLRYHQYTLYDI